MEGGEVNKDEKLPAGFRFHPTDEELITCYLINKISDANFTGRAIGDVDLNKCEPWDLPGKAKMGEKEWYFFSLRDRKYPTGVRTNRATSTGYWKTTGKDKEIYNSDTSELVGMKKTLVFYRGRAPRGEKTNWVMHEYRIHSKSAFRNSKQDEWVVCRVFQKSAGGKKFPSNSNHSSSRAPHAVINPYGSYSLHHELPQNPMLQPQMLVDHLHPHQPDNINNNSSSNNFQFPAGIRNYLTQAAIQELNKVIIASSSSSSTGASLINQLAPQLDYGTAGGCFTISGLNLNLGGPPAQTGLMHEEQGGGYGGDMNGGNMSNSGNNNNNNGRFMGMDQCGDLDNYWPSY